MYLTHIPDILLNYFQNGLMIDLISSLPLDLFYRLYLISGSPSPPAIIGQLLKLFRYLQTQCIIPPPQSALPLPPRPSSAAFSNSSVCGALWASSSGSRCFLRFFGTVDLVAAFVVGVAIIIYIIMIMIMIIMIITSCLQDMVNINPAWWNILGIIIVQFCAFIFC
jgi:hypothetical protein